MCMSESKKEMNKVIAQAIHDTRACYGVSKRSEIIFERRKMVKGERLQVLPERRKTIEPDH